MTGMPTPEGHAPSSLYTLDEHGKRLWVYPQKIQGFFTRRRGLVSAFLILFYLLVPWIKVDGLPAIQLNILERQFILLGHIFWPQDVKYLVFILLGAALSLFFFTALAGRLWCGWACPQTVFLEFIFHRIETWIEGDRNQRMALDRAPLSVEKVLKKGFKHLIFLAFASLIANTFLAYFVGVENVLDWMTGPPSAHWTAFIFMMANLVLFYFDFAWFREQFCTVLCPYARFQSALADEQTLQVSYDERRGEPRGKLGKSEGDCVDCGACVRVCPTGIDIRNGTQLECIGCARCIDACDDIMRKVDKPEGLVRYDSLSRMMNQDQPLFRGRVLIYGILLIGLTIGFVWSITARPLVEVTILRNPGEPYSILPDGRVSNHLSLRIVNKGREPRLVSFELEKPTDAELVVPVQPFHLKANSLQRMEVFVMVPQDKMPEGKLPVKLKMYSREEVADPDVILLGPQKR